MSETLTVPTITRSHGRAALLEEQRLRMERRSASRKHGSARDDQGIGQPLGPILRMGRCREESDRQPDQESQCALAHMPSSIQSWIQDQGRAVIAHGHSAGDQDQAPQGLYLFDAALGHVSALLFGYRADIEPQVALTLPRFAEDRATSFIHLLCENPAENLDVPPCEVLRIVQNFKRGGSRRKAALSRYVLGLRENGRQAQDPR